MSDVTVFAPSPTLTVTVEQQGDEPDVHLHAGGQGVWQARMLRRLGLRVTLCCAFTGEVGGLVRHLLQQEGFEVAGVTRSGRGSAYVHDRREGERRVLVETEGDPLARHDLDELYGDTLREGIRSGLVILSGPVGEHTLPADTYRRLAADLREAGATVVVDLAGERLQCAVDGGVDVLKLSVEELRADGLVDTDAPPDIMRAMRALHRRGAGTVIVTRAGLPLLVLDAEGFAEVTPPHMEVVDTRGAGDSLTAGVTAGIARGESMREAVLTGVAAGSLNVTRHGLGTGDPSTIARLRIAVSLRSLPDQAEDPEPASGHVSPDDLAALAEPEADR